MVFYLTTKRNNVRHSEYPVKLAKLNTISHVFKDLTHTKLEPLFVSHVSKYDSLFPHF